MAYANLTEAQDSLVTSTWPYMKKELIDAIFLKKYPFFWWLSQKGRIVYISSGRDIRFPLEVDVNPTVTEIGKTGEVSLEDTDPFTTVIYPWATMAGNITGYRDDDAVNRGREAIFNLLTGKRKNLEKSMRKKFESVLFRAEDSRPPGGFNSLLDLVDDAPTDSKTVGNYDQKDYPWWQNQHRASQGAGAQWLRKDMQLLYGDLEDVESEPDIILCHRDAYETYEDDLLEMTMIVNKALADASFKHLIYKGTPLLKSPSCPSGSLWMLNADYIYLVIHRNYNFEMTKWKEYINQPFNRVAQVVVKGQFICTHRGAQGQLHGITY